MTNRQLIDTLNAYSDDTNKLSKKPSKTEIMESLHCHTRNDDCADCWYANSNLNHCFQRLLIDALREELTKND